MATFEKLPKSILETEIMKDLSTSDKLFLQSLYPHLTGTIPLTKEETQEIQDLQEEQAIIDDDVLDFLRTPASIRSELKRNAIHEKAKGEIVIPSTVFYALVNKFVGENTMRVYEEITRASEKIKAKLNVNAKGQIYNEHKRRHEFIISFNSRAIGIILERRLATITRGYTFTDEQIGHFLRILQSLSSLSSKPEKVEADVSKFRDF